jgi:methionyl-tRNA formyltransferase
MRMVLFGDDWGVPCLLANIPREHIAGVVVAANRPKYHDALRRICSATKVEFSIQPLPHSNDYASFRSWMADRAPDLIFANSYSLIIREDILAISRLGGINIHGALLPQYRGCNPIQWAILNDEAQTGVTLHEMSQGIDEGRIIDQATLPIYFEDTWRNILDRIGQVSGTLIENNLSAILAGRWSAERQEERLANYHRRRTPDDGLFCWTQPVRHIYNLIRALVGPLPGAFYIDEQGQRISLAAYRTPAQVTQLKYGSAGGQVMASENLRLRPLSLEDCDPTRSQIAGSTLFDADTPADAGSTAGRKGWLESMVRERSDLVVFVIEHRVTREFIGTCQLFSIDWRQRTAKLKIRLHTDLAQQRNLDAEATKLVVAFGFRDLGLQKILLAVPSDNILDIASYEQCGFIPERQAAHAWPSEDNAVHALVMAIYDASHA